MSGCNCNLLPVTGKACAKRVQRETFSTSSNQVKKSFCLLVWGCYSFSPSQVSHCTLLQSFPPCLDLILNCRAPSLPCEWNQFLAIVGRQMPLRTDVMMKLNSVILYRSQRLPHSQIRPTPTTPSAHESSVHLKLPLVHVDKLKDRRA